MAPRHSPVGFFVNTVDPEGKGFVSYVWNFGDGQVSMDPPLTFFHTYNIPGSVRRDRQCDHRLTVAPPIAYVGVTVRPGIFN